MNVMEIDAASNNGVDNVRDLRDDAIYTPSQVKMRVYIIDEVHMLSISAFNALFVASIAVSEAVLMSIPIFLVFLSDHHSDNPALFQPLLPVPMHPVKTVLNPPSASQVFSVYLHL